RPGTRMLQHIGPRQLRIRAFERQLRPGCAGRSQDAVDAMAGKREIDPMASHRAELPTPMDVAHADALLPQTYALEFEYRPLAFPVGAELHPPRADFAQHAGPYAPGLPLVNPRAEPRPMILEG